MTAPKLPRARMSTADRAKIFIPFNPLRGFQEALRAKEAEVEALYGDPREVRSRMEVPKRPAPLPSDGFSAGDEVQGCVKAPQDTIL